MICPSQSYQSGFLNPIWYIYPHIWHVHLSIFIHLYAKPTSVLLPEKSHGEKSLAGYSPWSLKESKMILAAKQWHITSYDSKIQYVFKATSGHTISLSLGGEVWACSLLYPWWQRSAWRAQGTSWENYSLEQRTLKVNPVKMKKYQWKGFDWNFTLKNGTTGYESKFILDLIKFKL